MIKKYFEKLISKKPNNRKMGMIFSDSFNFSEDIKLSKPSDYCNNVIVNRCVNLISQAGSHVPWLIYKRSGANYEKLNNHPIYDLFKRPNPYKSGAEFFAELISNKLLYGNAYILMVASQFSHEIYLLPSNNIEIKTISGRVSEYIYRVGDREYRYPVSKINNKSQILHIKNYHPTDQIYGLPAIYSASKAIELHNVTSMWNVNLLKNGARPSGALILKDNNSYLTDEQFDRLQEQLTEKYSGAANSGKPLLLEGGLDWKEMSINPKDMDYIEAKNIASREIALSLGVPPQLLGINGDNTYSNMQEARLALWEETLLPLLDKLSDSLSNWLSNWYGDGISIDFDRDSISALAEKRHNIWDKISSANFMTINEKRALVGLPPIDDINKIEV